MADEPQTSPPQEPGAGAIRPPKRKGRPRKEVHHTPSEGYADLTWERAILDNVAATTKHIWFGDVAIALSESLDVATEKFGDDVYDRMFEDATIQGVINAMVSQVVQSKPGLVPSHVLPKRKDITAEEREDAKNAKYYCDFCKASVKRIALSGVSEQGLMREQVEASLVNGRSTAVQVFDYMESGPYAGLLMHRSIKTKPRNNLVPICDQQHNLLGVQAIMPGENWVVVRGIFYRKEDVDKILGFVPSVQLFHFVFWPQYGSPLGRSLLRGAFRPWQKRVIGDNEDVKSAQIHGSGMFSIEAKDIKTPTSETIQLKNSKAGLQMRNSGVICLPPGWEWHRHDPPPNDYFDRYLQRCRTDIVEAIMGAARAFVESNKGSKADATVAQDTSSVVAQVIADAYREAWQAQVIYTLMVVNFGYDIADKYCPVVTLNQPTFRDVPGLLVAMANMASSGMLPLEILKQMFEDWCGLDTTDWDRFTYPQKLQELLDAANASKEQGKAQQGKPTDGQPD